MSEYYGDFKIGQTVRVRFNTVNTSSVPTTLSSGTVKITKDGVDVTPSGGVTLAVDIGGEVGRHHIVIDLSVDPTTFSAGSEYSARLATGSNVAGFSVVGVSVGEWSIANRAVAPQTGDSFARLGAPAGASIAADIATRSTYAGGDTSGTTTLLARLSAVRSGYLDNLAAGPVALHSDITGLVIPSASVTAAAVWDLASATHLAAGTFGALAADKFGYKLAADGMDSVVVEAGVNARQSLALIGAATAGKASGLDTATANYYAMGLAGTSTPRIVATTDPVGNRTAITLVVP